MLKCSQCGSTRFIFTTIENTRDGHHGAICATCGKRLAISDVQTILPTFSIALSKTSTPAYSHSVKR